MSMVLMAFAAVTFIIITLLLDRTRLKVRLTGNRV